MIKKWVEYLKNNPKGYWFKRKLYGWGWVPAKRQGWIVLAVFIAVLIGNGIFLGSKSEPASADLALFFAVIAASVAILFSICWKKGERPCWQWGVPCEGANCDPRSFFIGRAIVIISIAALALAWLALEKLLF
ncbi:MAG: hypothetical protein MUD10_05445 [Candidatus Pacebacteria bacterium]|nr:hypothetical protein [Candidatus Paceibacterota bacterium]